MGTRTFHLAAYGFRLGEKMLARVFGWSSFEVCPAIVTRPFFRHSFSARSFPLNFCQWLLN